MSPTLDEVMKCLRDSRFTPIAVALLSEEGLEKTRFHEMLREIDPQANENMIDLMRMNTCGGLRSSGFVLQGGRKGRHLPYRITGFEIPEAKEDMSQWTDEDRAIYEECYLRYPQFDPATGEKWLESSLLEYRQDVPVGDNLYRSVVHDPVLPSMARVFENTYGNLVSYKIRDGGALVESSLWPGRAIIVQKNRNRPKFTIINYGLALHEIVQLATKLGTISYGEVIVENVAPEELPLYRDAFRTRGDMANPEAIYDCEKMINDPVGKFGSRGASYIRKFDRENDWLEVDDCYELVSDVITIWKETVGNRQRRLSILRDYRAVTAQSSRKLMFLGLRDNHPIACSVTDVFINDPTYAAKIVEKSLNYAFQPGGRPGTSAWTLYRTCQSLLEHGISWYNGGRIFGAEPGLAEHKQKLADDIIVQYDFNTSLRRPESR